MGSHTRQLETDDKLTDVMFSSEIRPKENNMTDILSTLSSFNQLSQSSGSPQVDYIKQTLTKVKQLDGM